VYDFGLAPYYQYNDSKNLVKFFFGDTQKAVEVGGIAPPDSWVIIQSPHYVTPTALPLYQN